MSSPYGHPQSGDVNRPKYVTVRAASTANIADLTACSTTMDGVTLVAGNLVLLKNQTAGAENGIYEVGTVSGSSAPLTRYSDVDNSLEMAPGTKVFVSEGTAYGNKSFVLTTNATITLGTTALTFSQPAGQINVPLSNFFDPDGDPIVKFVDGASTVPGLNLADSEAFGLRWNNHATPDECWTSIPMPQDLDDSADLVLHIMASKTGATLGDAVTFTVTAFFQTVGALHDADANCGGTSSAMTGDATAKTVQECTLTIAAANVPASPSVLSFTIQPTDGTLGTDDVIVEGVWFEYTRKALS